MAAVLLRFVAGYNLLDATQLVFIGALKGAGDTRFLLFVSVLLAAPSLYRALGHRGRNGIWVFWVSLEAAERDRCVAFLKVAMQRCWHLARDPDVTLPWTPSAEELPALLGSERIGK